MVSSSVIIEGILMIAAVVAASVFASTFVTKMMEMQDSINMMMKEYNSRVKTEIVIVYATYLSDTGNFVVYAMNTGKTTIVIPRLTMYFGNYTKQDLYVYDVDGTLDPGEWTYVEVYGVVDGLWNPSETLAIYIKNLTAIDPPYIVKIVVPNGYMVQEVFTVVP